MRLDQRIILSLSFFKNALLTYHKRLIRLLMHLVPFKYTIGRGFNNWTMILEWIISLVLLSCDLIFIPELICTFYLLLNRNMRRLTPKENEIKSLLFKSHLDIPVIMNESACILTRNGAYAFVSCYLINSCGKISDKTFAHELIHIYQFSKFGSPYIIRSLLAQRSKAGYDYGGIEGLNEILKNKLPATVLNYEQQGDVLADYFELIMNPNIKSNYNLQSRKIVYEYIYNQWV